ncbi:MAG: cytochrome c [Acidobacteria bacterium]|nr:MAG: cytochrome c [Acidobacteriota bacterium]REK01347.1 MAG: cytochrome c [Acidobacteriota bacterium]REK14303.1 MAG: cytochrome c [Acidobacteriota bacterium]REK45018.1 MAG: cytochrome c [Acidobacteriota bacterium]
MRLVKFFVVFAFAAFLAVACNTQQTGGPASPETPATPEAPSSPEVQEPPSELEIGKAKYTEYCVKCHKEDGTGGETEIEGRTINADDLTSDKMKAEPDEEYIEYMVKGIPDEGMPSFRDELSDEEMKAVVRYIREELQK